MKSTKATIEAEKLTNFIKNIVEERIEVPDHTIIITPEILTEIITKKKMGILEYIRNAHPDSSAEIAISLDRKKQAVSRDLKELEKHGLIVLEKNGRIKKPVLKGRFLMVDLG